MKISAKLLFNIIVFVTLLFIFGFLAVEVVIAEADLFDSKAFLLFKPYTDNPKIISFMRRLTFLGSPIFLFTAHLFIAILLLVKKQWNDAIALSLIAASGYVIQRLLKYYFQRARPDLTYIELINTPSFPSGHAMSSLIFAAIVIYLIRKTQLNAAWKWLIGIILIAVSLLIGISRVILKLHYASDVIAGFSVGMLWILFAFWLKERLSKQNSIIVPQSNEEQETP